MADSNRQVIDNVVGRRGKGFSTRRVPSFAVAMLLSVGTVVPFRQSQALIVQSPFHPAKTSPRHSYSATSSSTALFPHPFNGGYDAAKAGTVTWNPMQAAEFVIWHIGDTKDAGRQLQPLIQHWSGTDVGEFMTRLYLGEKDEEEEFKLSFESRNVRTPQWKGLDEDGRQALKQLLQVSLPDDVFLPAEIARFAEAFLLREHTWPSSTVEDNESNNSSEVKLEKDSFASLGHTAEIAKLFGELCQERHGEFTADDVLEMVLLPEKDVNKEPAFLLMHDFFLHIGIQLTPSDKIDIVQGMAQGGWGPATIAKFISHIQEIAEEDKPQPKKVKHMQPSFNPFPPTSKTATDIESNDEDEEVPDEISQEAPSPFYFGATHEYFVAASTNGQKQADSVRP